MDAKAIKVQEAKDMDYKSLDLLIVGSPTRAFRPSPDITSYINNLGNLNGMKVAVFDTRIDAKDIKSVAARALLGVMIKLFGYADKPMAKILQKKGGELIADPVGFYVLDSEGPLKNGEIEKAKKFANEIQGKLA